MKTIRLAADERKRQEVLAKERQVDAATTELRNVQFAAAQSLSGPIASTSSSHHRKSEAEIEMWDDYSTNGAQFSAGDSVPVDTHTLHDRLREEAESFGLLNPEGVAKGLGFGDEDVAKQIIGDDEEEDFLAEIMRNAGEWNIEDSVRTPFGWFGFVT